MQNLTFGSAIEALKDGKSIARSGWNGKGMCLWLNKGSDPTSYQNENGSVEYPFGIRGDLFDVGDAGTNTRLPNINMKVVGGATLTGWLASQTDILAEDWVIVE